MKCEKNCESSFNTAIEIIGSKWNLFIIFRLSEGTLRFTELQKSMNDVNSKTITKHLRVLEKYKIITRTVYPEVPPRVEYTLTEAGKAFIPILITIKEWGAMIPME
jgi:DNA-binding HxlR family transcriptional regulator